MQSGPNEAKPPTVLIGRSVHADSYAVRAVVLLARTEDAKWRNGLRATSRPFVKPISGRIAIKVINDLGDEVMKVFRV